MTIYDVTSRDQFPFLFDLFFRSQLPWFLYFESPFLICLSQHVCLWFGRGFLKDHVHWRLNYACTPWERGSELLAKYFIRLLCFHEWKSLNPGVFCLPRKRCNRDTTRVHCAPSQDGYRRQLFSFKGHLVGGRSFQSGTCKSRAEPGKVIDYFGLLRDSTNLQRIVE